MDANTLHVQRGEEISPAWKRLQAWVRSTRVLPAPGIRLNRSALGTQVVVERDVTGWPHPFKVNVAGLTATIDTGTIGGLVPLIDGVGLDGIDAAGKTKTVPTFKLTKQTSGTSWLCARVQVDAKTGALVESTLTIAEVKSDVLNQLRGGASPDIGGFGYHPLAVLYWSNSAVAKYFQITHHNLQHKYIAAKGKNAARHLFWV